MHNFHKNVRVNLTSLFFFLAFFVRPGLLNRAHSDMGVV